MLYTTIEIHRIFLNIGCHLIKHIESCHLVLNKRISLSIC